MRVFWSLNVLENQLLDQIYVILKNNEDVNISIFPKNINMVEFMKHPLSQQDNFILLNRKNIKNNNIYSLKFLFYLLINSYDVIDSKMAQSRESYIVYILNRFFKKRYIINLYGKERYILDKSKNTTNEFKQRVIKILKSSIFNICNDKTLVEVSEYVQKRNYLLYNAISINRFKRIKKEDIEKATIFYNHRLIPDKKPMIFFNSLKVLKDKGLSFKVIVVGPKRLESDLGQEVSKFIQNNNLDSYIEWIDQRVDGNTMDSLYARSDITVNMSELIVPSLATLEAMATKIAPIIADEIDSDKYVENGVNGFVIKPTSELLAEKLEILINDRDLREEFGKKSQERVEKYFDINKWGKIYGDIYRHILNNGPLPKPFLEYES